MPKIIKTKIKNNKSKKKYSTKTTYLISALKGFGFALNALGLVSLLLYKSNDFNLFYKLMIYFIIGLGGFVSGFISHNRVKGRAFLDGIIGSLIYATALSLILILLLKLNFSANMLLIYPVAVVAGFIGGVIKA